MKLVHLSTRNLAKGRDTFHARLENGPVRVTVEGSMINGSVYADSLYVRGEREVRVGGIEDAALDLIMRHPRIVGIYRVHVR